MRRVTPTAQSMHLSEINNFLKTVIKRLRPVSFTYKHQLDSKFSRYGFIAQELEQIVPDLVQRDKQTGQKVIRFQDMTAVL